MEENTTETQEEAKVTLKWDEDRERRRAYHAAYHQIRKATRPKQPPSTAKKPKKKGLIDWNNPVEVAALKRTYAVKQVECEVCKKSVHACSLTHHRRSRKHNLAVGLWLKS